MDHLQTDIDSLESEKGQLKEKLKSFGKKSGSATTPSSDGVPGLINSSGPGSIGTVPMQEGALYDKLQSLQAALKQESLQKQSLLSEQMQRKLNSLAPLPKFDKKLEDDNKIKELVQKKQELLRVSKVFFEKNF